MMENICGCNIDDHHDVPVKNKNPKAAEGIKGSQAILAIKGTNTIPDDVKYDVKERPATCVINVSGSKFEVSEATYVNVVKDIPSDHQRDIHEFEKELYVERHPGAFQCIIYYKQGGELHLPAQVCPSVFKCELDFWGIDEHILAKCCYAKYMGYFDDEQVLKILEADETARKKETEELMRMSSWKGWRGMQGYMWLVLNEPFYSMSSKIYFILSAVFIFLSLFALVAGTHSSFQRDLNIDEWKEYFGDEWETYKHSIMGTTLEQPEPERLSEPEATSKPEVTSEPEAESEAEGLALPENAYARFQFLDIMAFACMGFFSLDLIVRTLFCPFKFKLLTSFLNWVDIFSLLVMYLKYGMECMYPKEKYEASVLDILHCLQVVRVFRLFRLVKNFTGFRVLYYAFKASFTELMLMSLFLSVETLLFSTFAYFTGDDSFPSIVDSFWWTIVTMTTVGYGDVVPKLALSKIIGVFCAISGVCLIAVVVPIFVNNFALFYTYSKVWGKKGDIDQNQSAEISSVRTGDD